MTTSRVPDSMPLSGTQHAADQSSCGTPHVRSLSSGVLMLPACCPGREPWCPCMRMRIWRPRDAEPASRLAPQGLLHRWLGDSVVHLCCLLAALFSCCLLAALAGKGESHACVIDDATPPSLLVLRHRILSGGGDSVQSARLQMADAIRAAWRPRGAEPASRLAPQCLLHRGYSLPTPSCSYPSFWGSHAACLLHWQGRANPAHAFLTMRGLHPYWCFDT
jgi:hypothetical protein